MLGQNGEGRERQSEGVGHVGQGGDGAERGCGSLSPLGSEALTLLLVEITLTAQTEHCLPAAEARRDIETTFSPGYNQIKMKEHLWGKRPHAMTSKLRGKVTRPGITVKATVIQFTSQQVKSVQKGHLNWKPRRKMKLVVLLEQNHSQQTGAGRKQERAVFALHARPLVLSEDQSRLHWEQRLEI